MKIEIHDVDHGACVMITAPNGQRLMLDCGCSGSRSWWPSLAYLGQRIDTLMVMNLDEDHVEDLSGIWTNCEIGAVFSNPSVDAQALASMKQQGMRSGVKTAHRILDHFGSGRIGQWWQELGGIQWHVFWNRYFWDFTDTNNLSLAAFVTFGGFTILFGGDLETRGWQQLMKNPAFVARLPGVQVFVASHHGRENGCCEELFEYLHPELIIFSDGSKQHSTQETAPWYGARAKGIPDLDRPMNALAPRTRRVMTTRCDGTIRLDVRHEGRYLVTPSRRMPPINDNALYDAIAKVLGSS